MSGHRIHDFSGFSNALTHLSVCFGKPNETVKEQIFDRIEDYLPEIVSLKIMNPIHCSGEINAQDKAIEILNILKKLPKLTKIKLRFVSSGIANAVNAILNHDGSYEYTITSTSSAFF